MPVFDSPETLLAAIAARAPSADAQALAQRALADLLRADYATGEALLLQALRAGHELAAELLTTAIAECAAQAPARLGALRDALDAAPQRAALAAVRTSLAAAELTGGAPEAALARAETILQTNPCDVAALRIATQALERLGRAAEAIGYAGRWIAADSQPAGLAAALRSVDQLLAADAELKPPPPLTRARVAVVGNVTLNYLVDGLRSAALPEGLFVDAFCGAFDQYRQELLDPAGRLQAFNPQAVIVVLDWRELLPPLYAANLASDPAALAGQVRVEIDQLAAAIRAFRAGSNAALLVTGPVEPATSPLGFLDAVHDRGLAGHFRGVHERLAELATIPGVYIQQTERLLSAAGKAACLSAKLHYLGRMPYTPVGLQVLARDFASFARQALGKARKCLVLDLDNTLWGGIIGEDGLEGIRLGHEGLGRAFMDFQREVLRLHEQGVILALCSKNNEADALEVFEKHPDMVLKPGHFAAWRINWLDKPTNLRALADEINIGIDALVFLDDNPIERGAIRQLVPEVLVPDLPRDPADYAEFVRGLTCFATLQLTDEDLRRGQFYAGERQRKTLQEAAGNLDDYLKALGMVLHITPLDDFTRPRIVQLIHRTNQFNLTTRRHSEVDVRQMTPQRGYYVCSIRLEDRYGDNGTVGVAVLRLTADDPAFPGQRVAVLDTLLMSCRILGRNVEKMFLAHLGDYAAACGAVALVGEFSASAKNQMVADFYPRFGFARLPPQDSVQRWAFPLAERRLDRPPYISVRETLPAVETTG